MSRSNKWPLLFIDLIGGCTVAACLIGFVWFTVIRADRTSEQTAQLRQSLRAARRQLIAVRTERDQRRALLDERQAQLAESGMLPVQASIEEYFQMLSGLATRHRLQVLKQNPLTPRSYPGLLEQRFAYDVTGSMPDLTRFFNAIEKADSWADISYFKVDRGPRAHGSGSNARVAQLTVSVFSALPSESVSSSG